MQNMLLNTLKPTFKLQASKKQKTQSKLRNFKFTFNAKCGNFFNFP